LLVEIPVRRITFMALQEHAWATNPCSLKNPCDSTGKSKLRQAAAI